MQRFQGKSGRGQRTWEISRAGLWVYVRELGPRGKVLKNRSLQFDDPGKAYLGAENLIAKKLAEGYVEVLLGQTVAPPPATGNLGVLERALAADWDDLAAHQAYADALTETGDPRGEFIQVQLALEDAGLKPAQRAEFASQEQSLLQKHAAKWLGKRLDKVLRTTHKNEALIEHAFTRGWLTALSAHAFDPTLGQALAEAPSARFLQRLEILTGSIDEHGFNDESTQAGLEWLAGASFLGNLRRVTFGFPTEHQQALDAVLPGGPIADLGPRCPGWKSCGSLPTLWTPRSSSGST